MHVVQREDEPGWPWQVYFIAEKEGRKVTLVITGYLDERPTESELASFEAAARKTLADMDVHKMPMRVGHPSELPPIT